jgi:hypothetical protein
MKHCNFNAEPGAEPGAYLPSMQSLQKVIDQLKEQLPGLGDLVTASNGLYKLIQMPSPQQNADKKSQMIWENNISKILVHPLMKIELNHIVIGLGIIVLIFMI